MYWIAHAVNEHLLDTVLLIVLFQKTPQDVNNFDPDFTQEEPTLTPIDDPLIPQVNQDEFANFSFICPELLES